MPLCLQTLQQFNLWFSDGSVFDCFSVLSSHILIKSLTNVLHTIVVLLVHH